MEGSVTRVPYSSLKTVWNSESNLSVSPPWMTVNIDVNPKDKPWVKEASDSIHTDPKHPSVQKFLDNLKTFPFFILKRVLQKSLKIEVLKLRSCL